jgi:hypothetical protein
MNSSRRASGEPRPSGGWALWVVVALLVAAASYGVIHYLVVGPEVRSVLQTSESPNRRLVASAVAMARGGATVGYSYQVVVERVGHHKKPGAGGIWIWRSYRVAPTRISWLGDTQVLVWADRQEIARYREFLKTRTRLGVSAVTAPEDTTKPAPPRRDPS